LKFISIQEPEVSQEEKWFATETKEENEKRKI
jgi:hypothetical protein